MWKFASRFKLFSCLLPPGKPYSVDVAAQLPAWLERHVPSSDPKMNKCPDVPVALISLSPWFLSRDPRAKRELLQSRGICLEISPHQPMFTLTNSGIPSPEKKKVTLRPECGREQPQIPRPNSFKTHFPLSPPDSLQYWGLQ